MEEKDQLYGRWREFFNQLLNAKIVKKLDVVCMRMDGRYGGRREEERVSRNEVYRVFKEIKMGTSPERDGIHGRMLENSGKVFAEWITWLCL